jgi:acetyl esterase/lipase
MAEDDLEVFQQIAAMGAVFDDVVLRGTRNLYRSSVERQPTSGISVSADILYGADPRHRLDLYRPDDGRRPMLAYFHGGGFTSGDKNGDGVFYRNVGIYFARHGFIAAVPNYRLAPRHSWPAGAEDVAAVVEWMRDNADELGGDPTKLFLIGQSAGTTHVSTYLFHPTLPRAKNGDIEVDPDFGTTGII